MGCNGNCETCGGCGGGSCGGCGNSLEITELELNLLQTLWQYAFLPVARAMGEPTPVYLEDGPEKQAENALILQLLEKKGLISLDYDQPLPGASYSDYPIRGSIALTRRGQQVLELLEIQGAEG